MWKRDPASTYEKSDPVVARYNLPQEVEARFVSWAHEKRLPLG